MYPKFDAHVPSYLRKPVIEAYTKPGRFYHGLNHLNHMYGLMELVGDYITNKNAVKIAIATHDIVMGLPNGNEVVSAIIMKHYCAQHEHPHDIFLADRMIIASFDHHIIDNEPDIEIFLDLDLGIFAGSRDDVIKYDDDIRKEYIQYSDEQYYAGRVKLLHKFSEGPIYHSYYFRSNFENKAQENIAYLINKNERGVS